MIHDEKRIQVLNQCKVVVALAEIIAGIRKNYVVLLEDPDCILPLDIIGKMTAVQMERLGDIINGMDAATEEDGWMAPVFKMAQKLWPVEPNPQTGSAAADSADSTQDAPDVADLGRGAL